MRHRVVPARSRKSNFAADRFESFRELCFVGALHGTKVQLLVMVSITAFARTGTTDRRMIRLYPPMGLPALAAWQRCE